MNQSDPFSSYRLNPYKETAQQATPNQPQNMEASNLGFDASIPKAENSDIFSQYRVNKKEEGREEEREEGSNSFWSNLPRHAARIGSRVAETIGGIPGDIQNLIQAGTFAGLERIIGSEKVSEIKNKAEKAGIRTTLPSSSELEEASQKLTKGYTTPKNESEKLVDEYTKTVSSLLGPTSFRRALGISAIGTAAKKGAESLGFSTGPQEAAKLGTMIAASMVNPRGVRQLYNNYYREALAHVPEGTSVSAGPLQAKLNNLRNRLSQGIQAPTERAVLEDLERVAGKIQNGRVDVREMMATNRSINERMGDPALFTRARNLYPELKKAVNDSIKLYHNRDFIRNWRSANEAFGGLHESQKMSRWIQRNLGNKPLEKALFAAIGETVLGHPEYVLPTMAASGAAFLGVKGIELGHRIMSNPTLRRYYRDVLRFSAEENSAAMVKSAEKLRKELEKD